MTPFPFTSAPVMSARRARGVEHEHDVEAAELAEDGERAARDEGARRAAEDLARAGVVDRELEARGAALAPEQRCVAAGCGRAGARAFLGVGVRIRRGRPARTRRRARRPRRARAHVAALSTGSSRGPAAAPCAPGAAPGENAAKGCPRPPASGAAAAARTPSRGAAPRRRSSPFGQAASSRPSTRPLFAESTGAPPQPRRSACTSSSSSSRALVDGDDATEEVVLVLRRHRGHAEEPHAVALAHALGSDGLEHAGADGRRVEREQHEVVAERAARRRRRDGPAARGSRLERATRLPGPRRGGTRWPVPPRASRGRTSARRRRRRRRRPGARGRRRCRPRPRATARPSAPRSSGLATAGSSAAGADAPASARSQAREEHRAGAARGGAARHGGTIPRPRVRAGAAGGPARASPAGALYPAGASSRRGVA